MPLVFRNTENNTVSIPYSNILTVEAYTPPPVATYLPGRFINMSLTPEVTLTTRDDRIFSVHPDDAFHVCNCVSEYYAHTIPEEKLQEKLLFEL